MPKSAPVKCEQLVLCEDIRREENGKFMLLGVFPEGIIFPSFPTKITLALWIVVKIQEKLEALSVEIKVKIPGRKEDHIINAAVEIANITTFPQTAPIIIHKLPFTFLEAGKASISIRLGTSQKWEKIRDFSVRLQSPR